MGDFVASAAPEVAVGLLLPVMFTFSVSVCVFLLMSQVEYGHPLSLRSSCYARMVGLVLPGCL